MTRRDRSHWDWLPIVLLGLLIGLAMAATIAAVIYCARHDDTQRIDWSKVPVETPSQAQPAGHQAAFKRERQRMYAALAFERSRPQ